MKEKIKIDISEITARQLELNVEIEWSGSDEYTEYPLTEFVLDVEQIIFKREDNQHLLEFEYKLYTMILDDVTDTDYFDLYDEIKISVESAISKNYF